MIYRHPRPQRPAIFRRRMILQLTSLLDLLLIIVFIQYLEMQRVSAQAINRETQRRQEVEAQRDRLLAPEKKNLYEVWEVHVNGNKSVYPDGSILISSATQKRVFQPRDREDFIQQLIGAMKYSPRPSSPCIFLLTWGNVRRASLDEAEAELRAAANDGRLQSAWGDGAVQFRIVEGGYLAE
jgi:hypothetical protein